MQVIPPLYTCAPVKPASAPTWWKALTLLALLSYPVIGTHFLPLGPAARPDWSVFAVLMPLLTVLRYGAADRQVLIADLWYRFKPWLPMLIGYSMAVAWHQRGFGLVSIQLSRLVFAVIVYACARLMGIGHRTLVMAAALGCLTYALGGLYDYFSLTEGWPWPDGLTRHFTEGGVYRVGFGSNPITYGSFSIWLCGIVLTGLMVPTTAPLRKPWFWFALGCTGLMACLMSQSRGPLLALAPLVAVVFLKSRSPHRIWLLLTPIVVVLASFVALVIWVPEHRLVKTVFEAWALTGASPARASTIQSRLDMWLLVIRSLSEYPLLGPGASRVSDLLALYPQQLPLHGDANQQPHFHNDIMQTLAMGGLVLAAGQLATLVALLRQGWHHATVLWLIAASVFFGLSDRALHENNLFTFLVVALALFWAAYDNEASVTASPAPPPSPSP